ncbi:hypothetical protein DC429_08205 [Arthrobacter sp. TPD3018]|uniref:hypothetical protein n=1 Tax=Bacteria TaxID=2 RepID=UPI000D520204|nr:MULTISPECIES: hypothetical protein [Bacteria]PVE58099.1 hypothetical protein DC425_09805 [Sphingomonas sp. TPD3009]PVE58297.1 hypothetical protein DC429_08205 [Arthrobacter sp. TPD3018]PVE87948.1 hypothetical protein DC431_04980 [Sphingomonas melonis]
MGYDSRRWTGRYAPGEMPPEFGGGRPYRSRKLRWWLLVAVIVSVALAVGQMWLPDDHGVPLGWFVITTAMNVGAGRSPFAKNKWGDYDEFERGALMRATQRAYWVVTALGAGALGWCATATAYGWPMPHRWGDWAVWGLALAATATNLPALFAEWAIPFPDPEDAA